MNANRRTFGKMLLTLPAAAALPVRAEEPAPSPSPAAPSAASACLAGQEAGLSEAERTRLTAALARQDAALAVIRDFKLPFDVEPAFRFAARRSKPKTRGARGSRP